jgi:hypothetical protein
MDLERGSSTVVRAYVRPPGRRRPGRLSMASKPGVELSALALARGLLAVGADAVTTYREGGLARSCPQGPFATVAGKRDDSQP